MRSELADFFPGTCSGATNHEQWAHPILPPGLAPAAAETSGPAAVKADMA